jgi:intraflagellar transport protein 140
MGDAKPIETARFPTTARAIALRDETIFRASNNLVELCNLQGIVRQKITFSEGEGSPTHLDVNGDYLAVATDTGLIKIFQVTRREPKQLGSPGHFHLWAQAQNFLPSNTDESVHPPGSSKGRSTEESARGHAIRSIRCNADGTRVSILADHVRSSEVDNEVCRTGEGALRELEKLVWTLCVSVSKVHGVSVRIREPDSRLHVYDSERDIVDSHDFGEVRHFPVSHYWDPSEPKLLACETRRMRILHTNITNSHSNLRAENETSKKYFPLCLHEGKISGPNDSAETRSSVLQRKLARKVTEEAGPIMEVTTLFVTAEYGILLQDTFPLEPPLEALLGVQVPRLFFTRCGSAPAREAGDADAEEGNVNKNIGEPADNVGLCGRVMRDFVGLDDADARTRSALLDFSFYLTVGNMDEAHRAVRLIKSPSVWENMAHMCVKTKRLDVAEVCLGHMGHARGAAAVRATKNDVIELEARVASVAVQLGLRNDAARLYRECRRFDLLNELYQAAGEWELALDTAAHSDRIHLRSTHHRYARHLEALGSYDGAARHFELADTHRREVPRMLVARGEQAALEHYVMRANDAELLKWWAGYCESLGHLDSAQHCYESAGDHYSLVRVACFSNETNRAAEIVHESCSTAGAYHLARHLEGRGDINEAIQYFAKSGCYNHAIRLARQYQLDTDLLQFSIKARPSLQVDCAKALDLCFKVGGAGRAQMFEVLSNISKELDDTASPAVVARCAEFFVEHGQYEKAVKLYITGGRYAQAIALCSERHVAITDELAEAMTPPKHEEATSESNAFYAQRKSTQHIAKRLSAEERVEVLLELARACKKQNSFQLACKKFTQAGDRPRALKCLLKSGDTKNIIYYASVSRHRDIYILAANYLQSLDWQSGSEAAAELTKKIVEFYTKARAHEPLAAFYDAYAQMEIDEFRDYEKALGALKESRQQLEKARKMVDRERRITALESRISIVSDFVEARRYEKSDPQKMADVCTALLQRHDVESVIRVSIHVLNSSSDLHLSLRLSELVMHMHY